MLLSTIVLPFGISLPCYGSTEHAAGSTCCSTPWLALHRCPILQDVYSWAMIMCEMLTGQLPWLGCNNMAIICNVAFKHERPELPGGSEGRE
jgi:hypothetical protein